MQIFVPRLEIRKKNLAWSEIFWHQSKAVATKKLFQRLSLVSKLSLVWYLLHSSYYWLLGCSFRNMVSNCHCVGLLDGETRPMAQLSHLTVTFLTSSGCKSNHLTNNALIIETQKLQHQWGHQSYHLWSSCILFKMWYCCSFREKRCTTSICNKKPPWGLVNR